MEGQLSPSNSNPPDVTRTTGPVEQIELNMETVGSKKTGDSDPSAADMSPVLNSPEGIAVALPVPKTPSIFEDQNQNRLKHELIIDIPTSPPKTNQTNNTTTTRPPLPPSSDQKVPLVEGEAFLENGLKFFPSSARDLELMKNIRKVYISHLEDVRSGYKIADERGEGVFETVESDRGGGLWARYFSQEQKLVYMKDKYQHGILKFEFGRSRTVSCCQTLRFAALSCHFKSKSEEPLCIIFKDRGCCIYSCCSSDVTYESVPQMDNIHPFTVRTKRQWKNRAEFMVKHSDGSILAFIDKEKKFYTLTMGENLKPPMKVCLIGFVVTMDIMDREDTGRLNCYLRPSTYVTILFLLMLFLMIGAFLFHFITAMVLAWPAKSGQLGCSDGVHVEHDPLQSTTNFNHTSESFPSLLINSTYSANNHESI